MRERVDKGIELYKKGYSKRIILSGGFTFGKMSEAQMMRKWIGNNIQSRNIVLEQESKTTIENVIYTKKIMDKLKLKSAVVVTSDFHVRRTRKIFTKILYDKRLYFSGANSNISSMMHLLYWIRERVLELELIICHQKY